MTHQPAVNHRPYFAFGFVITAFATIVWLVKSPVFHQNPSALSAAITVDLLLTVPLIYAWLIHKTRVSKLTVAPLVMAGMFSASYLVPAGHQQWLHLFKLFGFPLMEIASLTLVLRKFMAVRRRFGQGRAAGGDFFDVLKNACYAALPRTLAAALTSEISVIYYGIFNWKSGKPARNQFTYHQNSGTPALLGCLIFLILIESAAMHLLVARWNHTAAWILSGLSVYTALQFFGYARSLSKRLISINGEQLQLRYGIMAQTHIHTQHIGRVEQSGRDLPADAGTRKLSPLGQLEAHNIILHLNRDHVLHGLFGKRYRVRTLLLHVDDPARFKAELDLTNNTGTKTPLTN
ncbi:hypothetical protein [Mucilaginibacter sp. CSA2-8R]|uniref:hypothetical protein n=1 Tax=Mucilaginibacter sp. CSA2-8R TaxID=3141542 RepID=UPI00315D696F